MTIIKKVYSVYSGSDPVKWLVLMRYGLKKGEFLLLEGTFWGSKVGFKGFGYWVLGAGCWGLVCIYCGCAAVNTNLGQSSLGSGLACCGWRQYILEIQVVQQPGVLVGQLGAQGLDLILDIGVFFQAALEKVVGQLQLCLYAGGDEVGSWL